MELSHDQYKWETPLDNRHDVLVPEQLCMSQEHPEPYPHNGLIPCNDLHNWLDKNTTFYVHSKWSDGCSLYLINPSNEILVELKLLFSDLSL